MSRAHRLAPLAACLIGSLLAQTPANHAAADYIRALDEEPIDQGPDVRCGLTPGAAAQRERYLGLLALGKDAVPEIQKALDETQSTGLSSLHAKSLHWLASPLNPRERAVSAVGFRLLVEGTWSRPVDPFAKQIIPQTLNRNELVLEAEFSDRMGRTCGTAEIEFIFNSDGLPGYRVDNLLMGELLEKIAACASLDPPLDTPALEPAPLIHSK